MRDRASVIKRSAEARIFSLLADLELMAGHVACDLGKNAQADDERRHYAAFRDAADTCGGYRPGRCETVADLCAYLQTTLPREWRECGLNMVAEYWLVRILSCLHAAGFWPDVIGPVLADEEGHVAPVDNVPEWLIRDLEHHLDALSQDPDFLLPFFWGAGPDVTLAMGRTIYAAHDDVCAAAGLSNGLAGLKKRNTAYAAMLRRMPTSLPMTRWQKSKMHFWADANAACQRLETQVAVGKTAPLKIKMEAVRAVSRVLSVQPHMLRLAAGGQLWTAREIVIGTRETLEDGAVATAYFVRPHRHGWRALVPELRRKRARLEDRETIVLPPIDEGFAPPSACVAIVTTSPELPGSSGTGPFILAEGVPLIVTVGGAAGGQVSVTIIYDHRAGDGAALNAFGKALKGEIERVCNASNSSDS